MDKAFHQAGDGTHPFAELVGFRFTKMEPGDSECILEVDEKLFNPHRVLHGGVLFSMADTGMGGALYPLLGQHELCASVETKICYFRPVVAGTVLCKTKVINKGKTIATMETEIWNEENLVAKALGTYSIFEPAKRKSDASRSSG
jgi:acyl-CoA thioesterase